ncbi:hypothetical protein AKJ41_05345, partial [candidate division MSBL1 archaeon SCGC-AAA259O05]
NYYRHVSSQVFLAFFEDPFGLEWNIRSESEVPLTSERFEEFGVVCGRDTVAFCLPQYASVSVDRAFGPVLEQELPVFRS